MNRRDVLRETIEAGAFDADRSFPDAELTYVLARLSGLSRDDGSSVWTTSGSTSVSLQWSSTISLAQGCYGPSAATV